MAARFNFNPFDILFEVFAEKWPDREAVIDLCVEIEGEGMQGCHGCTDFDSSPPRIGVSGEVPLRHAAEIVAHELAHVAAGIDEGHGPGWEAAFEALHEGYTMRVEEIERREAEAERAFRERLN